MKNTLDLYNNILFLNLRPWKFGKQSEAKFKQLLRETKKEYYSAQPNYEVDFIKPLSAIRKYYTTIIEYEAIRFLNILKTETSEASNLLEIKYNIHVALNKTITQKLVETANLIKERGFTTEQFNLNYNDTSSDINIANQSYVLHLLKHQIIRLFMEIQDSFGEYLTDEPLTMEDIYNSFFNEESPKISYIIEAANYPNTKQIISKSKDDAKPIFKVIRDDLNEPKKNVYSYQQLVANPSRFANIEEELFKEGLINCDYKFTDEHGKKQYMAAFYHQLIRKGYFNNRVFPDNIELKPLFIRKFLDNRYSINIDKQFRNWSTKDKDLLSFIEKDYWLDNIELC